MGVWGRGDEWGREKGTFPSHWIGTGVILDRHYIPHLHLPMHAYTGAFELGRIGLGWSYNGIFVNAEGRGGSKDGRQYGILNIASSSLEGPPKKLLEA